MGIIEVYAFLAVLVAVMATVDLYHPVISKFDIPKDIKFLYYFVCFTLAILVAPVLVYPCISKTKGVEFRDKFEEAVFNDK
jgi:hypothetical protein